MKQLELGTIIDERYMITEFVTEGGMGQLFKVRDLRLEGMIRAMKVLKSEVLEGSSSAHVRESEAKLLTLLQHQGLPIIYDHFYANEYHDEIIVMEWIEGQQLDQYCAERRQPLTYELIVSMSIQLIEAIQYLHEQTPAIIHRDIKPTNIMVCRTGQLKLIDFGISKLNRAQSEKHTIAFGTPEFAAPEQMKGLPTDERSDLYSFGCILYFLCSQGKQLRTHSDLQQVEYIIRRELSHIPKAFRQIILHCLQPDPQYRIIQASQVRSRLLLLFPHNTAYDIKEPLYSTTQINSIGVFSLNSHAGATTIAMLIAQYYALHHRVNYIEYCGRTACLESVPALQKRLSESNPEITKVDRYYDEVTVDLIEYHIFRSVNDNNSDDAMDSFMKRMNDHSNADYQLIDFSSGWIAEQVQPICKQLNYVILVCDPAIIASNERIFRNIQRLLMALQQHRIPYTWINNKDTHFRGRKSWNALNNGRDVYSVPLISQQAMYTEMWSRNWLSSRDGAFKKLKKNLMPLIDSVNSSLDGLD